MAIIQLPPVFSDHMILQRNKPVRISGSCEGSETIRIVLGSAESIVPVRDGRFSCVLPGLEAQLSLTMRFFADGEKEPSLVISDVSVGDVWMACGQSNMEYFLRYDAHWNDTAREARNPMIRMFNVPRISYEDQVRELKDSGFWFSEGAEAWLSFSAPGHAFARTIQPRLNVPVGIIGCNWGGTPACAWMSEKALSAPPLNVFNEEYDAAVSQYDDSPGLLEKESLEAIAHENSYAHEIEWRAVMYGLTEAEQAEWMAVHADDPVLPMGPWHHYRPSGLRHTMLETVAPFSVRGFLWYQGESDSGHADIYDQTMKALIQDFRELWQDESLPFLYVQLAPFGRWLDCTNEGYAMVRRQQDKVSREFPGAYMTSIMDLGSWEDIHPKFKKEVGQRLGALALGHVYGIPAACDNPEAEEITVSTGEQTEFKIRFRNVYDGLFGDLSDLSAFRVRIGNDVLDLSETAGPEGISPALSIGYDTMTLRLNTSLLTEMAEKNKTRMAEISYADLDYCEVRIWNS
ncbi:MAG: sialate O-acetylesterase, partial [Lachnospiraceae bacterium]|nr:sialate O-acetylesterase [Lachnospiraceae bacterium]